ncbi:DNA-binding GntR family transcriptional regulator [Rhodococcus percolatus]|uniref:GntR family transcriptional regulator n=1 Tax=Rhodococcus opacus TaxID=37919 RepID=UPI0015FD2818|nr:GntR family transcriptional regulator [Rhodococcus opacus]MBP2202406.1 DNA-binding GntR family transcriptional regulator [Rhodococcus opacus]
MLRDNPVERPRMSDVAFERICDAIVTGELAPGSKVKDSELAEHLGLSRTPVREALTRLIDTGLVEAKPAAFTRITPLNRADVEATLAVMEVLDQLAVKTGVPNLTDDMIDVMRTANDDLAQAIKTDNIGAALAADDTFHGVIVDAAGNPLLKRLMHQVHPQIHRIYYRKFSSLRGWQDAIEHHDNLITLCAARDEGAAAEISSQHRRFLGGLIGELFDIDESTSATS